MARRPWRKNFSELFKKDVSRAELFKENVFRADLFKKDVSREVQTPQLYLKLARKCMESAERMTSQSIPTSLQFNHGQCEYLANKLKAAVRGAEDSAWPTSSETDLECVQIMKHLWRSAKEVESFIQSCRRDNWIQAAMGLANMCEHMSQLSDDLEFCTLLIRNKFNPIGAAWQALTEFESNTFTKSEAVKEIVSRDQSTLLRSLETVINHSRNSGKQDSELAKSLSSRLTQHLSGSVQLSDWKIQYSSLRPGQKLGNGSAGMVRKSKWLGEEVAEKVFIGSDHPSFINEVKILGGLSHPNVVPLLGYATEGKRCFIVMELMDGDLLSLMEERIRQSPKYKAPFTISEAVDMMLQTAEGMRYLHEHYVVHRDLKSQNILVKSKEDVDAKYVCLKVADFGLSRTKESSSSYSNQTANTGTTRWMAPELMPPGDDGLHAKASNHDPKLKYPFKVDVYSFGMVCYEILTGELPFSTISSLLEVKKLVLKGGRPELPDQVCPQALKQLLCSCWDAEASCRPSFVEISKRLRRLKYLLMICSGSVGRSFSSEASTALALWTNFGYENDFKKKYKVGELLGVGRYCKISVAIQISTGIKFAVKCKEKLQMTDPIAMEEVEREVKMLRTLSGHEDIVKFYAAFEDDDYVYIVMELCEGGNLLDRMKAKGKYSEKDAARIVRQMLNVAARCHLNGFVHRDMRPEHLLFKSSKEDSPLKATGFGHSYSIKRVEQFCDAVGTPFYMAPEVLKRKSGPEADVWSIGVITYILLCGVLPFGAETEILWNKPDFQKEPWPSITSAAKDFVKKLLVTNPHMRLTAAQALSHPWVFNEERDASDLPLRQLSLRPVPQPGGALRTLSCTLADSKANLDALRDQFDSINRRHPHSRNSSKG